MNILSVHGKFAKYLAEPFQVFFIDIIFEKKFENSHAYI